MTLETVFVFQPFVAAKKGSRVLIGQPMAVRNEEVAKRALSRALTNPSSGVVGGVILSTIADTATGECEGTSILAKEGNVPEHFLERLEH
ncbi:hypothetical protein [Microvirga sp. TS319]|uniref:hypothetical protein n=1 Tax=Microvirga sp. TS319 TaxID=3241165 RepID=UPI00351A1CA6